MKQKPEKRPPKRLEKPQSEDDESKQKIGPFRWISTEYLVDQAEHRPQADRYPDTPLSARRPMDTPASERIDPSYCPSETPRSRRELQTMRFEPPVTRARAKALSQDLEY